MKSKILFISIVLFAIFQLQAQEVAQTTKVVNAKNSFKRVIKIQPINLIFGEARIGYEQQISKRGSLDFYTKYENADALVRGNMFKIHGITLEAGYRHYLTKKEDRLQGFYARGGLSGGYAFAENKSNNKNEAAVYSLGVDAHIGYQVVLTKFLKGLTLDANFGGNLYHLFTDKSVKNNGLEFLPTVNFSIGYSF